MRLASFNVENLFERARALNQTDREATRRLLDAQASLNATFRKPKYTAADRRKMVGWLADLGLARADESKDALLRQNRGKLRRRQVGRWRSPPPAARTGSAGWN
ncbi:hypothetical protein ACFQU2_12720 [Siccirubricoccus deserti]